MASTPDEPGSRLWRGMRALIFGDDGETSLRDQIEDAIDASETVPTQRGDLSPIERQMLRNLLHFGVATQPALYRFLPRIVPRHCVEPQLQGKRRFADGV